jgi:hypothetical protein
MESPRTFAKKVKKLAERTMHHAILDQTFSIERRSSGNFSADDGFE